jgi:two-component system NtrC family response regulator
MRLGTDAVAWLMQQPWPGNVRQLRQSIERTVLVSDTPVLEARHFQAAGEMEPRDGERDALPPVGSMTMDELEKAMILKSLRHHQGNISRVAQALGLSRAALYRRIEKYEIPV